MRRPDSIPHRCPLSRDSARRLVARVSLSLLFAFASAALPAPGQTQEPDADLRAIASWTVLDVAPGYESRTVPALADALDGWDADPWGNLVREVGAASGPTAVIACALDRPAYAVTHVTHEGYLRLHRIGRGSRHPLWDQQHEAQLVRILTRGGPVPGVIARSNGHFAAQHRAEPIPTTDDLWLDVGASTDAEVSALGIELLDPVVRHLPPWITEGGEIAAASAGSRVGCAALAAAAEVAEREGVPSGRVLFVMSAQEGFGWVGLSSLLSRIPEIDRLLLLGPGASDAAAEPVALEDLGTLGTVLANRGGPPVRRVTPRVADAGAHLERVTRSQADGLLGEALAAAGITGVDADRLRWVPAPAPAELANAVVDHEEILPTLDRLVELHGASGHEWAVRRDLLEAMPGWARERAVVDDIGNVMVAMGPDRDTTVFMAHLDEVGYQIESVDEDGTLRLERLGGALNTAWEGQTALVHFDPEEAPSTATGSGDDLDPRWKSLSMTAEAPAPLRGVFSIRADADAERNTENPTVHLGLDRTALEARGVRPGLQVTSWKEGIPIGRHRFVGRGLDDRAGTTALLLALDRIDPERLPAKVIFTWSVHEEGGLIGAEAMARRFGPSTTRIYSVDTFVSSDTPLESPHFAFAPLGGGPVLRAIENSGVSPDRERDRVRAIANRSGVALQIGLTQGGTDGTTFTFRGAPNQGLSWPGRYSHSPGEVLDLRDLERLVDLITEVARTP